MLLHPLEEIVHVAQTGLQQDSGSGDQVPVLVSNEQRTFEGSARETGMENADPEMMFELKLMARALDLSRGELSDWPEDCCHHCWTQ